MLAITVIFEIDASDYETFRPAIVKNAEASRHEPGCRQFDVCFSADRTKCFLYELYDDGAAFDYHLTTSHFHTFDAVAKTLVKSKIAGRYDLVSGGVITPKPSRA